MSKIKKFGVFSVGKIYAIFMAIVGFIAGILYAIFGPELFSQPGTTDFASDFGAAAIIVLPLVYAILGFIIGVLAALLYNLIAKFVGGIEIEIEK